jgi:hypothetical protein
MLQAYIRVPQPVLFFSTLNAFFLAHFVCQTCSVMIAPDFNFSTLHF